MRIRELLENKDFNDLEFVKKNGHSEELDYDLVEDLIHYMNEDDDAYRRHIYPVVSKCINSMKANRKTDSSVFKNAVAECYKTYIKKSHGPHTSCAHHPKAQERFWHTGS